MASCPYCSGKVTLDQQQSRGFASGSAVDDIREVRREIKGAMKKEVMYVCPHCDVVLGFGFFMGGLFTGRP